MAFPTGWGCSAALEIQASQVDANQVDYPLLLTEVSLPLSMFDADGSAPALNGGGDIRFSLDKDGNTQLACEVVTFSTDNDPSNGKAEIWVKVPSLSSSTDTIIYIWYKKADETQPAPGDTYGSENVWDTNFNVVQHMEDATTSSITDSTSNHNDGTKKAANEPTEVAGLVGKGQDFDGVDDYISLPYFSPPASLTLEAFVNCDSLDADREVVGWGGENSGTDHYQGLRLDHRGLLQYGEYDGDWSFLESSANSIIINNNYHVAITKDVNACRLFIDGNPNGSGTLDEDPVLSHLSIGITHQEAFLDEFAGIIDEVRISDVARSAAWFKANFNNQNDPASFVATYPEIAGASIAPNNVYVKLSFSRDVWGDASQSTTISKNDFEVIFSQNPNAGGLTTGVEIEDLYTSVALDTKLAAGTGYSEVYAKLTLFGNSPAGVETIEFKPASAFAIYGVYGNAMPASETSGVLTLNAAAFVTLDWSIMDARIASLRSDLDALLPSLAVHGLHVFSSDKSLFRESITRLRERAQTMSEQDRAATLKLLNFFDRVYGK